MSRNCTICCHPGRDEIDYKLVHNGTIRSIAAQYKLSSTSVQRHRKDHLPQALSKAQEAIEILHGDSLLEQLRNLSTETYAILKEARTDGSKNNDTALKAIARAEKQLELLGKLLGDLPDATTNAAVTKVNTRMKALFDNPRAASVVSNVMEKLMLEDNK